MDAVFDENFTSPLSYPDLPFQGAIRLRNTNNHITNTDTIPEMTGLPSGTEEHFPDEKLPQSTIERLHNQEDIFTSKKIGRAHV